MLRMTVITIAIIILTSNSTLAQNYDFSYLIPDDAQEDIEKRTEFSKTFSFNENSFLTLISIRPIHQLNRTGGWADTIDLTSQLKIATDDIVSSYGLYNAVNDDGSYSWAATQYNNIVGIHYSDGIHRMMWRWTVSLDIPVNYDADITDLAFTFHSNANQNESLGIYPCVFRSKFLVCSKCWQYPMVIWNKL